MTFPKKYPSFIFAFILVTAIISCNSHTRTKMDDFVTGEIKIIDINKDGYGIVLNTAKDSSLMSIGFKEDLKADSTLLQNLQPGQEISIKGYMTCYENPKRKEEVCFVEIKKIKFPS